MSVLAPAQRASARQSTAWLALFVYPLVALPLAAVAYLTTFREGRSFLETNLGATAVSSTSLTMLCAVMGSVGISMFAAIGRAKLAVVATAAVALSCMGVASSSTLLVRSGLCLLGAPGWLALVDWLPDLRRSRMRFGPLSEWTWTLLLFGAAWMLVLVSASVYVLLEQPGMSHPPDEQLYILLRAVVTTGAAVYSALAVGLLVVVALSRSANGARLMSIVVALVGTAALVALLLIALRHIDPKPTPLLTVVFGIAHGVPLWIGFGRILDATRTRSLAHALGGLGFLQLRRRVRARAGAFLITAAALGLLLLVQLQLGRWHLLYSWGESTSALYSALGFAATYLLLSSCAPSVRRMLSLSGVAVTVISMMALAVFPEDRDTWANFVRHDRNLNSLHKGVANVWPTSDETAAQLRELLAESERLEPRQPASGDRMLLRPGQTRRPHVFFIVADGLRRASYGDPGHDESRYPGLALLKETAVDHRNAWTSYNATTGSLPSMLAGTFSGTWYDATTADDNVNVLVQASRLADYRLMHLSSFAGLDSYWPSDSAIELGSEGEPGDPDTSFRAALAALDEHLERHASRPAFVYIHVYNMHQPLIRRPEAPFESGDRHWMLALYANNVAYFDRNLRGFLEGLQRRGIARDSLIVLTADHGEEMFEFGGLYHGWQINPKVMRVPLFIQYPRWMQNAPQDTSDLFVNLVDVAPTVTEVMGVPLVRRSRVQGVSLLHPTRLRSRRCFPLLSWVSPLVGQVCKNPPRMQVLDTHSGERWAYAPIDDRWQAIPNSRHEGDLESAVDSVDRIISFWKPETEAR